MRCNLKLILINLQNLSIRMSKFPHQGQFSCALSSRKRHRMQISVHENLWDKIPPVTWQSRVTAWPWLSGPNTSPSTFCPVWSMIIGFWGGTKLRNYVLSNVHCSDIPITESRTRWYFVGLCRKSTLQVYSPEMIMKGMSTELQPNH